MKANPMLMEGRIQKRFTIFIISSSKQNDVIKTNSELRGLRNPIRYQIQIIIIFAQSRKPEICRELFAFLGGQWFLQVKPVVCDCFSRWGHTNNQPSWDLWSEGLRRSTLRFCQLTSQLFLACLYRSGDLFIELSLRVDLVI